VRKTRRPTARAHSHEALLRLPMDGLRADVARMALRVGRAFLDRDRDGLLVFFVGVVFFRVAAAVYFLTNLLVAAAPVVHLASPIAVSNLTSNTPRRVVGQWGGASGAICEDHFGVARGGMRVAFDGGEAFCLVLLVSYMPLVIVHRAQKEPQSRASARQESLVKHSTEPLINNELCSREAQTLAQASSTANSLPTRQRRQVPA
jgi:hypothetical protein